MMVTKHTVYDSLHSLLLIINSYLQVIVPAENRIHYEMFSGFIFDGFLDDIHGFL